MDSRTPPWPRVSIVVPALNEARLIGRTLAAVRALDYPAEDVEIVVVDNGSNDGTVEIARTYDAVVLACPGLTVGGLRNAGVARATGAVIAFLDADCVPDRDWLRRAIDALRTGSGVTGARVAVPETGGWVEQAWFSRPALGRRRVAYINSGNLILERSVFETLGGFNPMLISGEDSDFCRRAAAVTTILADDRIRVVHLGNPKSCLQFLKREIWHGMGAIGTSGLTLRNKPLIGAVILLAMSGTQVVGLLGLRTPWGRPALMVSTAVIAAMTAASAVHRMRSLSPLSRVIQLAILFYLYYWGRAVALLRLLGGLGDSGRSR
jgi:glycosyltransferase involved in cell wall biosynthesis